MFTHEFGRSGIRKREVYYKLLGYNIPGRFRLFINGVGEYRWAERRLFGLLFYTSDWFDINFPSEDVAYQFMHKFFESRKKYQWTPVDRIAERIEKDGN